VIRTSLDNFHKPDGDADCLAVQLQLLTVAEMFVEDATEEVLSSVLTGRDGMSKPSSMAEAKRQLDGNNKCLLTFFAFHTNFFKSDTYRHQSDLFYLLFHIRSLHLLAC